MLDKNSTIKNLGEHLFIVGIWFIWGRTSVYMTQMGLIFNLLSDSEMEDYKGMTIQLLLREE